MIEADQIFIRCHSRTDVIAALKNVVVSQGFSPAENSIEPPERYTTPDRKKTRSFYVATPINDWVCVLEARGGDEELARSLSSIMRARVVWFSYSGRLEEASAIVYDEGAVKERVSFRPQRRTSGASFLFWMFRQRSDPEAQLQEYCDAFYATHGLPWPFYSYEQIDGSPNRLDYFERMSFVNGRSRPAQ